MGRSLIASIAALLMTIGAAHADSAPQRVIFDQHLSWLTRSGADQTLQRIKDVGFNRQDRNASEARPDAFGRYPAAWESVSTWNRSALSALVQAVAGDLRRTRPGTVLSIDTIAEIREFRLQGADAVTWANEGWIDAGPIDAARRHLTHPEKLMVLLSTADWPGTGRAPPVHSVALPRCWHGKSHKSARTGCNAASHCGPIVI